MISPTLTALAQRELGPGYLVRITEHAVTYCEAVELLGYGPALIYPHDSVLQCLGRAVVTYDDMAASELSICGQRRRALEGLIADQLAAVA